VQDLTETTAADPPPATTASREAVSSLAPGAWRRAWLTGLSVWGAAELTYLLINSLLWMTRSEAGPKVSGMLEVWNRWDTGHYVTIALDGYNPLSENPAFFPLYPLLMHILEPVLPGGMLSAGLIVSSAACVVALAFIYRLVEDLFGEDTANRTTLYLMAFPFAFYLVAAYNQSLFLALSVGSLYFMRRGLWWYAGVLAGFASATRQAGVLLALAFAVEYLRQREWRIERLRWDAMAIALVPSGLIAFMIYSGITLGDPLKFMHVQAYWGREVSLPWIGAIDAFAQLNAAAVDGYLFQPLVVLNIIDLLALPVTLGLLVMSVVGRWKLGPECWYLVASAAATFLLVLLTPIGRGLPPLHGVPRYALEILPAFIVLARTGANRYLNRLYLLPAMGVQSVLVLAFFNNVWLS
jgi:Gpi18-like mannosyltransferase